MLLAAIRTDRHLDSCIDQTKIAAIRHGLYPFIDEIKIDIDSFSSMQTESTGQQSRHLDEKGVWITGDLTFYSP